MSKPLISVITPSYDQAEFLEQNLRSVMEQKVDNIEHIVVDGGSNDGTLEILREFEDKYNLRWISESDRGQSHAFNKGLKMASGKWIGWQNSDDFYTPQAFSLVEYVEESAPETDAIYGDVLIVDSGGTEVARKFVTRPSNFIQKHWSLFASNQSLFIKRGVLEDLGGLDEDLYYTMDAELLWNLLSGDYQLTRINRALGAFRIQKDAKTYQDVDSEQMEELESIYPQAWYERYVPQGVLSQIAKSLKFSYLVSEPRFEALKYNLLNSLQINE